MNDLQLLFLLAVPVIQVLTLTRLAHRVAPNWSLCLSLASFLVSTIVIFLKHKSNPVVGQAVSRCPLFASSWTPAHPTPLFCTLQEFAQMHVAKAGDAISSSATPFFFCIQSFPTSGSFPMSRLFTSGGQIGGASVSAVSPSSAYSGLIL